jgi:hypothetical protein
MYEVPIESLPNQNLTVTLDSVRYVLTLREGEGKTCTVSVTANGNTIIDNVRAMPNQNILPYPYLESDGGNFAFNVDDGESYPYWEEFGITQRLIYASPSELEALRNG